jgi:DnaJ-class molecular chaperone
MLVDTKAMCIRCNGSGWVVVPCVNIHGAIVEQQEGCYVCGGTGTEIDWVRVPWVVSHSV